MKTKDAVAVSDDSENEFEVDEPEEVDDHSDDEWAPSAAVKTPGKRGRPAKNTPGRKKKTPKVEDDEDEDEVLPKKARGSSKPKPPTPAKGRGRVPKGKAKKNEEPEDEDELDDDELVDDEDDELEDEDEDVDDEEDEYDDEEEELNQGPNAKPSKKFTSGAFVVLKTDMIGAAHPPVWKIDGKALLQKYVSFKQDGKLLYKNTSVYSGWGSNVKDQYYAAPVSFIQQTRKEHIIEFFRDKIKMDPKIVKATNKDTINEEDESTEEEAKYDQDEA